MAENMSNTMRPVIDDVRVTRFVGKEAFPTNIAAMEGQVYTDGGFMSTAIVERGTYGAGKEVKMIIDIPQGTKARYVDNLSSNRGEKELILDRSTPMIVTKVDQRPGGWNVYLQVLQ
jgi:hypothetical protein